MSNSSQSAFMTLPVKCVPRSDSIILGTPHRDKICSHRTLAVVVAVSFTVGMASTHLENMSTTTKAYRQLRLPAGSGPIKSICRAAHGPSEGGTHCSTGLRAGALGFTCAHTRHCCVTISTVFDIPDQYNLSFNRDMSLSRPGCPRS